LNIRRPQVDHERKASLKEKYPEEFDLEHIDGMIALVRQKLGIEQKEERVAEVA